MPDDLTGAEFHAFGYIVSTYAKVEVGFKLIIGRILGLDNWVIGILSEPYGTMDLRNVTKSIVKSSDISDELQERIVQLVGDFKTFSGLRTDICHSMWGDGICPNSIRPLRLDIRSGKLVLKGVHDDDKDWALDELEEQAKRLNALHARQVAVLKELGFPSHSTDDEDHETISE